MVYYISKLVVVFQTPRSGLTRLLVAAVPLLFSIWRVHRRAKKAVGSANHEGLRQPLDARPSVITLFWQLDVIGIFLLIAVLGLVLVPLTIAGDNLSQWKTAQIITPLVIGIFSVPIWIYWESHCKHPMIPFRVSF